jgi:hypothetical protein
MKIIALLLLALQFAQRPSLTPAETLLEPVILRAIIEQPSGGPQVSAIEGADKAAGEIFTTCRECDVATQAMQKLHHLVREKGMPAPARTIRLVTNATPIESVRRGKAAIFVAQVPDRPMQIVRGLWSTAGINDEVVEIVARHGGYNVEVRPFEFLGQMPLDHLGIPTTTVVANPAMSNQHAAFVVAASSYFLATLPNAGAEALLSHLTVGAHARLAEDGRRAVALMGNQQRAGGDVLVLLGQAIEREQRRMRDFERYMPVPVDAVLRSRIGEMERGITSVFTSLGITSSPFVPAAERLRGRAGEDRRVVSRATSSQEPDLESLNATAKKLPNGRDVGYEMISLVDGKRSLSDIRDLVSAEFGAVPLAAVVEFFESLARSGAVSLR